MRLIIDDSNVRATALQLKQHCDELRSKSEGEVRDMLLRHVRLFYANYPNEDRPDADNHQHAIYRNVFGDPIEMILAGGEKVVMISLLSRLVIDRETSLSALDLETLARVELRTQGCASSCA